jgi:hypothetical protein
MSGRREAIIVPCRAGRSMGALWRLLGLGCILYAGPAFGGQCPAAVGDGEPALQGLSAEARLQFIQARLRNDARNARIWSYAWAAIYSSLATGQLIAAPLVSHSAGLDLYVGGGAAVLGVIPFVVNPLKVMADEKRLDEAEGETAPCVRLAQAEMLLERDAASEALGRGLLFHVGNLVVNTGLFFILGSGFGHWTSATISLLTGVATGEIMSFTQPTGAIKALRAYRRGDLASPSTAVRIAIAPLIAKDGSGLVLLLAF